MTLRSTLLPTCALLALCACSAETPEAAGGAAEALPFLVWPEDGATVFANTGVYVGDPGEETAVEGTIAVVVGGEALAVGAAMPDGAMKFEAGKNHGYVSLPVGEQTLHVHHFDAAGKATDQHKTVSYTVEATPSDLGVSWLEPQDGATVKAPFKVRFGMTGADMSPAGQNALDKTTGHHHITINKGSVTPGVVLPMETKDFLHYGKAQTEAEVTLEPGTYELTMQFADAAHRSYGKWWASKTIKVTVE